MADIQVQYTPRSRRTPEEIVAARKTQYDKYNRAHRAEQAAHARQYYADHKDEIIAKNKLKRQVKREQAKKESESSGSASD